MSMRSPSHPGAALNAVLLLVFLSSTLWATAVFAGLKQAFIACAGLLTLWAFARVWKLIVLAVLFGAAAWWMNEGEALMNLFVWPMQETHDD